MIFESLSNKHENLLLTFEAENRAWFETLISSRGDQFYTKLGIKNHISECIASEKIGKTFSGVLLKDGVICARANLKDIAPSNNSCSVGYRVGKNCIGKGIATYCLSELICIAKNVYGINVIEAQVLSNNPASFAVLVKNGFKEVHYEDNFAEINGEKLGCRTLERLST